MRRLLWAFLAISVALNIFFIGGALYGEQQAQRLADPQVRLEQVAKQLSMTADQAEAFKRLSLSLQERRRIFREYMDPVRYSMADALVDEAFDREAFRAVIAQRQEVREEYFLQIGEELHAFLWTLSPEQRATFLDLTREEGFLRRIMKGKPVTRSASAER